MATHTQDPVIFAQAGIDPSALSIVISHPTAGSFTVYDAPTGGWKPGYNGTIDPNGSGGYNVTISTHPDLEDGEWTVTVVALSFGGLVGGGAFAFFVGILEMVNGFQSSLNTVDIIWSKAPLYLDPSYVKDSRCPLAYVVTGPFPSSRQIQAITLLDDGVTIRIWFDGPLVAGELYSISMTGLESESGNPLFPDPSTVSFVAFGPDRSPVSLEEQTGLAFDIRNPQSALDAPQGAPLATFVVDADGDLSTEAGRPYLRKRVFRRLATPKGSMVLEPDYGLSVKAKGLYKPSELRALQQDVETQVRREPGVVSVRASVSELAPGVVLCQLKVRDSFGDFTAEQVIRGR